MIPGMHPRTDWQTPAQPVKGPAPRGKPHTWVIHYAGGGSTPTEAEAPAYLQAVQNDYTVNRQYSIGYSWGCTLDGSTWQIRGDDFNNAANPGRSLSTTENFNNVSQSIFLMTGRLWEPLPQQAVDAVNSIIATHPDWDVVGHQNVDATACPGAGVQNQIDNGVIGYQPPAPLPPTEPTDMTDLILWTHHDHPGTWLIGAGTPVYVTPGIADHYRNAGVQKIAEAGTAATDARNAFIALSGVNL